MSARRAGAILAVADVDRSVAFYRDQIGFDVEALYDDPPYATLTLAGAPRQAPDPGARERLVVSSAWLAQHVNDADLVLLHVGAKATYDAGHIANARFVTLRDFVADTAAPDALTLEKKHFPQPELTIRVARSRISCPRRSVHRRPRPPGTASPE